MKITKFLYSLVLLLLTTASFSALDAIAGVNANTLTITSSTTNWTDGNEYLVENNVTINSRIIVNGNVRLYLGEGKTLTAKQGIELSKGNTLTIHGYGSLNVKAAECEINGVKYCSAAIGAYEFGELIIYGGNITATGYESAAAIGGSYKPDASSEKMRGNRNGGSITIDGGEVKAVAGIYSTAIGSSEIGFEISISILGGKVTADKGTSSAEAAIGADWMSTSKTPLIIGFDGPYDFIQHNGCNAKVSFVEGTKFVHNGGSSAVTEDFFNNNSGKYNPGFTVSFDANGGSSVPDVFVASEGKITRPTTTRTGYEFIGWKLKGFDDYLDFSNPVLGDLTLVAQWQKLLTNDDITIPDIAAQTYTGSAIEPEIIVKDGNNILVSGTDYTVTYSNNINVGTSAKATITGKGNYSGTVEKTFSITPKVTTLGALTLTEYGDRTTATIQGEFTSTETTSLEINDHIDVSELTFQRTFKAGVPATVMLPFSFAADKVDGKFYTLASVAPINGVWTATMSNPINEIIKANTPYIFKANSNLNKLTFENGDDGITLQSTKTINDNGSDDWTLHGVYEKTLLGDPNQINYGFAGQATDDGISVGDFIRAGEGVWADPMRCYLTYKKGELTKAAIVLPDRIRVVFPDEVNSNNEITNIIENTETEDVVTPVSEFTPENGVKVWSYDGTIYIEAQPDMDYTIVDLTGRTIKKGITHSTHEELNLNTKGIVIVKIGNKTFKLK